MATIVKGFGAIDELEVLVITDVDSGQDWRIALSSLAVKVNPMILGHFSESIVNSLSADSVPVPRSNTLLSESSVNVKTLE